MNNTVIIVITLLLLLLSARSLGVKRSRESAPRTEAALEVRFSGARDVTTLPLANLANSSSLESLLLVEGLIFDFAGGGGSVFHAAF